MYGVVLWSDRTQNCAVIWCEDHCNLAYFKEDAASGDCHGDAGAEFNPGDLVEFDIREEENIRFALAPSVVAPGEYPSLPEDLIKAGAKNQNDSVKRRVDARSEVLMFPKLAEMPPNTLSPANKSERKFG